jgi:hypothetical protein
MEWPLSTLIRLPPPPLSATTASHHNQMPSSNSLTGGSAYNDRPLVLKGQNVLSFLLAGRADVRLSVGPILFWFRPKTATSARQQVLDVDCAGYMSARSEC